MNYLIKEQSCTKYGNFQVLDVSTYLQLRSRLGKQLEGNNAAFCTASPPSSENRGPAGPNGHEKGCD
ncbi:hypothetical protein F0562_000881 [Nyssa sinensis]|uniref:Uncharacterized protein n=1 Tax=Nyssa sinensis TaxID=561372 RepID=A0A5J5C5Q4_9ASTE|nr:hypothetical protein F0562_000881 [Nyssa sinensis]